MQSENFYMKNVFPRLWEVICFLIYLNYLHLIFVYLYKHTYILLVLFLWRTVTNRAKSNIHYFLENNKNSMAEMIQFSSVAQSCPTLCDPMSCSTLGLPVQHQLPESTQTHVHCIGDAIQPSHPLSSPSPLVLNLSQHQDLLKWVSSSHQAAKVLEFQLQYQSLQWTPRNDLL